MAEMTTDTVVLVGGPDAGKTNYLGRLWVALDSEQGVICKNGMPSEIEYLRTTVKSLNSGQFAPRTAPGVFESTTIPVKWDTGGSSGQLVVPDCAGEQWERIHKEREWDDKWEQAVASMAGCILFFRGTSEHNVEPLNWSNHSDIMACLAPTPATDPGELKLPTQVVLVDWLQCLSTARREIQSTDEPLRLSIVLSAWDEVPQDLRGGDPDEYLSRNLPLLHDFLAGNPQMFKSKPFGVSIAGGPLSDEDTPFMQEFFRDSPNKSGYVVFTRGSSVLQSSDFTLPLAWAFGCECEDLRQDSSAP